MNKQMTHDEFKSKFLPLQPLLFREAMRILCDRFEAEDAVQNLYVRLWGKRDELENLLSPASYCSMMLRNICIDRLRRVNREPVEYVEEVSIVSEEKTSFEINDEKQHIRLFLSGLPPQQRKVVMLRMNGHNYDEIASLTGLSAVNVRVIITRLKKRLREFYNNR